MILLIRNELNNIYWLNKEIEDLENRIKELDETCGVSSSKMSDGIHTNKISNPIEELTIKKLKFQERLFGIKAELLEEKEKIERFVQSIPDSQIRTIIRLRNIDLKTWEEIGEFLGLDRKTVASKYNKFVNEQTERYKSQTSKQNG